MNPLALDTTQEIDRVAGALRSQLAEKLNKRGLVVAISGGIDSSTCAGLAVAAVGARKVFGLLLPEADSSPDSTRLGRAVADHLGIDYEVEDISAALAGLGCYQRRDDAIRSVFPDYAEDWKNKIVLTGGLKGQINRFELVVENPRGEQERARLPLRAYLQIVAATNFKQRVRKMMEYFHADRLNYAVVGTPNRLEYDLGFFVKNGDGSADVKPIAHLYKTQVYELARALGLPDEVCNAQPTTDTYSLAQSQEEFYFALPYQQMDLALWSYDNDVSEADLARQLNCSAEVASAVYRDIEQKRRTTAYLHAPAILIDGG